MSVSTSTNARTAAAAHARLDAQDQQIDLMLELLSSLRAAQAQYATPSAVAEITSAPSARKAASKAVKATSPKAKRTSASTATSTTSAVVSIEEATRLAHTGVNPWTIKVASSTTGAPVPFFRVAKALKIALPAYVKPTTDAPAQASTRKAPAKKATQKAVSTGTPVSALLGKTGAELVAMGTVEANAEIARRAAKRAAKAGK